MKVVSRYCDSCGIKIHAADIKEGRAFKFEDSFFCADCKDEILPIIKRSRDKTQKDGKPAPTDGREAAAPKRAKDADLKPPAKPVPKLAKGKAPAAREEGSSESGESSESSAQEPPARGKVALPPGKKATRISKRLRPRTRIRREEEEDEEGEGEEGGGKARRPRARGLPVVPFAVIGGGLFILFIILAVVVFGGNTPPAPVVSRSNGPSPEDVGRILYEDADRWYAAHHGEYREAIARFRAAAGAGDAGIQSRANDAARRIQDEWNREARGALDRLREDVSDLLDGRQYEDVLRRVEEFPAGLRTPEVASELATLADRARRGRSADGDAEVLIARANELASAGEWLRAQGVLHAFPDEYQDLPAYQRISATLDAIASSRSRQEQAEEERRQAAERLDARQHQQEQQEAARSQAMEQLASITPEPQIGRDLLNWNVFNMDQGWRLENGVVIGQATDQMNLRGVATDSRWRDYLLEFEFQPVRGTFAVGVRAQMINQGEGYALGGTMLDARNMQATNQASQWYRMRILVQGETYARIDGDLGPNATIVPLQPMPPGQTGLAPLPSGGFFFLLQPNSEIRFRNVALRIISRAE